VEKMQFLTIKYLNVVKTLEIDQIAWARRLCHEAWKSRRPSVCWEEAL